MSDITSEVPQTSPLVPLPPPSDAELMVPACVRGRRLRLWPGLIIVALEWLAIKLPALVAPASFTQFMAAFWGPMIATLLLGVWWLFVSRIRWFERCLGLVIFVAAGAAAWSLSDLSLRPVPLIMFGLPLFHTVWVLWLLITPSVSWQVRYAGLAGALALTGGYVDLWRMNGVDGSFTAEWALRWQETAEQKYLAERAAHQKEGRQPVSQVVKLQPGDWPGFRGPDRDGRQPGVRIAADWKLTPPQKLWRQRVGPGWSSFAVVGDRLYTQEQRGPDEVVSCYDANTGKEIWAHTDKVRFAETVAGPGPRATPTFHDGKIYSLGASGLLNCLDAATGEKVWTKDIVKDSGAKVPTWGFAASPLVVQGVVTVFAGGDQDKSMLGYDAETGELAWTAGTEKDSYCSPQRVVLDGYEQVLIATGDSLTAHHPKTGKVLWQHEWEPMKGMARVVQPALVSGSDLLLGTGFTKGTRRVRVSREGDDWKTEEVWTTRKINPYYNDLVIHRGHLYGFDGLFFTCVSLEEGEGKWRARGYGGGQVLLLPDQDLLLILSEKGEVALVEATPEEHKEVARFQAIEGKTWNHPVVAHGKLFVRNGEEMACYQLTPISEGDKGGK